MSEITETKIEFETFDSASFEAPIKQADLLELLYIPLPGENESVFPYKPGEEIACGKPIFANSGEGVYLPRYAAATCTAIGVGTSQHPIYGNGKYAVLKTGNPIKVPGNAAPVPSFDLDRLRRVAYAAGITAAPDRPLYAELGRGGYDSVVCDCTDDGPYCFANSKLFLTYTQKLTKIIGAVAFALGVSRREIILNLDRKLFPAMPPIVDGVRITDIEDDDCEDNLPLVMSGKLGLKNPLVLTPSSLISLYNAFALGMIDCFGTLSIYDIQAQKGGCYHVPYGSMIDGLLDSLGYKYHKRSAYIGNPIAGNRVFDFKFPFSGDFTSIVLTNGSRKGFGRCISCGRCDEACPVGIYPSLAATARFKSAKKLKKFGIDKCNECRLCSYVCPADFDVAELIISAKEELSDETQK